MEYVLLPFSPDLISWVYIDLSGGKDLDYGGWPRFKAGLGGLFTHTGHCYFQSFSFWQKALENRQKFNYLE